MPGTILKAKGKRQKARGKSKSGAPRTELQIARPLFIFAFCLLPFAFFDARVTWRVPCSKILLSRKADLDRRRTSRLLWNSGSRHTCSTEQRGFELMRTENKSQRGFSLVELMIVISIIGILVAIGIPAWQSSMRSANAAGTSDIWRR